MLKSLTRGLFLSRGHSGLLPPNKNSVWPLTEFGMERAYFLPEKAEDIKWKWAEKEVSVILVNLAGALSAGKSACSGFYLDPLQ